VELLLFLILFPLIIALLMYALPEHALKHLLVRIGALVIGVASVYLVATSFAQGAVFSTFASEPAGQIMFVIEMLMALFILYMGVRYKNYLAVALILVQSAMMIYFETTYAEHLTAIHNLFVDDFTLIMTLIIGIIGSLICVYSIRYMKVFHEHHPEVADRRRMFFFVLFAFLSAMFGLVFSNNLVWVYFFWEVTTLCSFVLIGYTQTEEAIKNSFRALWMNLLGGLGFAAALLYLAAVPAAGGIIELDRLIGAGQAVALIPAVLICFAGLTKSAQLPFSSWLVGAMVAPTPVSALLHSSTMVKAGVYIIIKMAPVLQGSIPGLMLALVGGFTFLLASGIAISQSNAKKVLAYSTIANLGLVVACGGIGTYEAVWAAILLIIFHAISKSLLFLSVGTVEHQIGSRDIEDMEGLIARMPRVASMMMVGIAGMFLAPFGMLISKWATLRAFIDVQFGLILVAIVAFGSAVTLFFWTKWMGKLIAVPTPQKNQEGGVGREEIGVLYALTVLTVGVCLLFPLISSVLIEPYVLASYGKVAQLGQDNVIIMLLMLFMVLLMPLSMLYYRKDRRHLAPYMGGRATNADMQFKGTFGVYKPITIHNYYMENIFGETKLMKVGVVLCTGLIVLMAGAVYAGVWL